VNDLNKLLFLLGCLLLLPAPVRADVEPPLLTAQDIAKSNLNPEEKRLATLTLDSDSVINCFSAHDVLGSDFERLRIYHLEDNLSVAVFQNAKGIRVFESQDSVDDFHEEFRDSDVATFSNVDENFDDDDLTLQFGRDVPIGLKFTLAVMADPEYEAELVCFVK
jgi:hypothetical protein